jgi:hypothetical protein
MIRVNQEILDLIKQKYQIVNIIDLFDYDLDIESMADVLALYFNAEFTHSERLVVLHHDVDFYPSGNAVGNTIYNFLRLCSNYMISLDHIIVLTNHYGIESEIKSAASQICNDDSINVIYTSQWYDFPSAPQNNDLPDNIDITNLYCCLNGLKRQHRVMTLCMLKEYNLLNNGIVSYHFKD